MDESSSQDPKNEEGAQSVDLTELKSFSFGTQWSESPKTARPAGKSRPGRGGPPRGDRPDRRPGGPPSARKDRRPPRAAHSDGAEGGPSAPREAPGRRPARGRHAAPPPRPYESDVFDVCFYPEDNCFSAIIKAMRANHLTYELFHVAKLFLEKPDRFIASITRKAEKGQKPEKVFICVADGMPFATEEEVIAHAMAHHAEAFFDVEEVEVDPPTGNFTFVNRCPFTKELLGPPNYHKYEQTLRNHHRARLPNMPFEKLQSSVETVRDEEAVNQWLESQKKATRYKTKAAEGEEPATFNSLEDATGYLRTTARAKVVKQVNYARVHGTELEKYPSTEANKAVQGERERQLRFPLDTANAIRGRMRREKFSIYKKGSKGVTYVCATKRNFRTPGQVMAPDLDRIIRFLESHELIKAKELSSAYAEWLKNEAPDHSFDEKKLLRDLHWLVADGYVTHFEDDSLLAQPVLDPGAPKSDKDEHDSPPAKSKEKRSGDQAAPNQEKPAKDEESEPATSASVAAAPSDAQTQSEASADQTPAEPQEVEAAQPQQDSSQPGERAEPLDAPAPEVEKAEQKPVEPEQAKQELEAAVEEAATGEEAAGSVDAVPTEQSNPLQQVEQAGQPAAPAEEEKESAPVAAPDASAEAEQSSRESRAQS